MGTDVSGAIPASNVRINDESSLCSCETLMVAYEIARSHELEAQNKKFCPMKMSNRV